MMQASPNSVKSLGLVIIKKAVQLFLKDQNRSQHFRVTRAQRKRVKELGGHAPLPIFLPTFLQGFNPVRPKSLPMVFK